MLAIGYVLQRTILDRSLRSGVLMPILATFGLSIVIQNLLLRAVLARRALARRQRRVADHRELADHQRSSRSRRSARSRSPSRSACSAACTSSCTRTRYGSMMRATAQDVGHGGARRASTRARVYAWATAIAVATAALAGLFLAHPLDVRPDGRADAADLRVRGRRDRRPRVAVGDARRRDRARRRRRRSARRSTRNTRSSRAISCSWPCSPAPRRHARLRRRDGHDRGRRRQAGAARARPPLVAALGRRPPPPWPSRSCSRSSRVRSARTSILDLTTLLILVAHGRRCGTPSPASAAWSRSASRRSSASAPTARSGSCNHGMNPYRR